MASHGSIRLTVYVRAGGSLFDLKPRLGHEGITTTKMCGGARTDTKTYTPSPKRRLVMDDKTLRYRENWLEFGIHVQRFSKPPPSATRHVSDI
jgi:hypothetical protein